MAWKTHPSRKKHKTYKRFSSTAVKTRSQGPTANGVFNGRTIPEAEKALFQYRRRGEEAYYTESFKDGEGIKEFTAPQSGLLASEDQVAYSQMLARLFPASWKTRPKELSEERQSALFRKAALERLTQIEFLWEGETVRHNLRTWNMIELVPGYFFTKLFFEGHHYVILQRGLDGAYRRSIVYNNRDKIFRAFDRNSIVWAECFDSTGLA